MVVDEMAYGMFSIFRDISLEHERAGDIGSSSPRFRKDRVNSACALTGHISRVGHEKGDFFMSGEAHISREAGISLKSGLIPFKDPFTTDASNHTSRATNNFSLEL